MPRLPVRRRRREVVEAVTMTLPLLPRRSARPLPRAPKRRLLRPKRARSRKRRRLVKRLRLPRRPRLVAKRSEARRPSLTSPSTRSKFQCVVRRPLTVLLPLRHLPRATSSRTIGAVEKPLTIDCNCTSANAALQQASHRVGRLVASPGACVSNIKSLSFLAKAQAVAPSVTSNAIP